ncbi:MAG: hypothetical protein ACTSRZ_00180 [Promethearchaeota archaeon]
MQENSNEIEDKKKDLEHLDSFAKIKEILRLIEKEGEITQDFEEAISQIVGKERYLEGKKYIKNHRIKRYLFKPSNRELWIAYGNSGIYLIYPGEYCSCIDFYITNIVNKKKKYCKHLLAQGIIEATLKELNKITVELNDNEFEDVLEDIIIFKKE